MDLKAFMARTAGVGENTTTLDVLAELIAQGDGLEVSPVATNTDAEGNTACEVCEENDADMWSVYIHRDGEGVECVADFPIVSAEDPGDTAGGDEAHDHALDYANVLLAAFPQLAKHGINNSHHEGAPLAEIDENFDPEGTRERDEEDAMTLLNDCLEMLNDHPRFKTRNKRLDSYDLARRIENWKREQPPR